MTSRKRDSIETAWGESCVDDLSNKTLMRLLFNRNAKVSSKSKTKEIMIEHLENECIVDIDEGIIKQLPVKGIMAELKLKGLSTLKASKADLIERYLDGNARNNDIQQPPTKKQRLSSQYNFEKEKQNTKSEKKINYKIRKICDKKAFKWSENYNHETDDLQQTIAESKKNLQNVWWNDKEKVNETRTKYINGEILDGDTKYFQHYHVRPVKFVNRLPLKHVPGLQISEYEKKDNYDINVSITDFDIICKSGEEIECRLEIWEGDEDTNTGCFGQVKHRKTGEILASINGHKYYGDCTSFIKCNTEIITEYESDEYDMDFGHNCADSMVYISHGNLSNKYLNGMLFVVNDDKFDDISNVYGLVQYYGGIIKQRVTSKINYLIVSKKNKRYSYEDEKYRDAKRYGVAMIGEYELKESVDELIKENGQKNEYNLSDDTYLEAIYANSYELEKIIGVAMNLEEEINTNPKIFSTYWPMTLRIDFCESKILNAVKCIVDNNNINNKNGNDNAEMADILKNVPILAWKCVSRFVPADLPAIE